MPCLRPQLDSDSDGEESDDNHYQSDKDCDSEREDAVLERAAASKTSSNMAAAVQSASTDVPGWPSGILSGDPRLLRAEKHGDPKAAPNFLDAQDAHTTVLTILKPKRVAGKGYVKADLDLVLRTRLEWMMIFLWIYVDVANDLSGRERPRWIAASLWAASTAQKGTWFACLLRECT